MRSLLLILTVLSFFTANAQYPTGGRPPGGAQNLNIGRFYGRIVDGKTNKGIEAASVQILQSKIDSVTKVKKDVVLTGQLTKSNGDFSLEGLPLRGQLTLKITR